MRRLLLATLAVGFLGWSCALPDDQLSEPDPLPEGPATTVAPPPSGGPAPQPGATPVLGSPSAVPTPAPETEEGETPPETPPEPNSPPQGSGCGEPTPPPITRFKVTTHLRGADFWVLDATPLVGPDVDYCASIGFTDGRQNCPVRPEGHPEREACEAWAVGTAVDTGRPGPTWRRAGNLCTGPAGGCENHPENQYLLKAFLAGTYTACARNGACGTQDVDR
jgi:hypothetical protein